MAQGTVVVAGSLPVDGFTLEHLIAEFGWSLQQVRDIQQLAQLDANQDVIAVLFDPRSLDLPWERALHAILKASPGALPIVCHGFADGIEWPAVAEAGGFHSLFLPFNQRELRQSLGFVWDAKCREAHLAPKISLCYARSAA